MNATGFELILPFLRPIEKLILDPDISEIMVNGPERVFIERRGYLESVEGVTLNPKSLAVAVKNIARRLGDDISEEKPILDSRLPDGSRVSAVMPPCSLNGVILTIRKFNSTRFGIEDLIARGTLTRGLSSQLRDAVLERQNILISGGTGTGKTTLLNALADLIPADTTGSCHRRHGRNPNPFAEPDPIRGAPRTEWLAGGYYPRSAEGEPPSPSRPDFAGGNPRSRSFRSAAVAEYRALGNDLDCPCEFSAAGHQPFHQLRSSKRCRTPLPRH